MNRRWLCAPALLLVLAACEPTTKTAVVDGEHVIVKGHKITLHQLDTPDSKNPKCDGEKSVADLAEERLGGLLLAAKEVEFRKTGMACLQFMECDGFVLADGVDVGETLIGEGLAAKKPVEGSGETPHDWCAERMPEPDPGLPPEQTVAPPNPT
jgi:endonuclease YncB( thermonuclease family)